MQKRSIISHRLFLDYVKNCGDHLSVDINKTLMRAVRFSCQMYVEPERKQTDMSRKRIALEITKLNKNKGDLEVKSSCIKNNISFFEGLFEFVPLQSLRDNY